MPQTTAYRPTPTNPTTASPQPTTHEASDDTDAVLDDIDECLEENALEVVRAYVQKGGQAVAVFLDTVARGFGAVMWRFPWADQ